MSTTRAGDLSRPERRTEARSHVAGASTAGSIRTSWSLLASKQRSCEYLNKAAGRPADTT